MRVPAPLALALSLVGLGGLGGPPARADDEGPVAPPVEIANAVLVAVQGGDEAPARRWAADRRVAPFVVANEFLARIPLRHGTPKGDEMLASAQRWARLVADRVDGRDVAPLVDRWRGLSKEQLALEQRVYDALMRVGERIAADDVEGLESAFAEAAATFDAAPWSLSAVAASGQAARAFDVGDRGEAAMEAYEALGRRAASVGWAVAEAEGWEHGGKWAWRRKLYDRAATDASKASLAHERAGDGVAAAKMLVNASLCFLQGGRLREALDAAVEARARARALPSPLWETHAIGLEARVRAAVGDLEGARRAAVGMGEPASRAADRPTARQLLLVCAHELLRLDAWTEALAVFESLEPLVDASTPVVERFLLDRGLALLHRAMGRPAEAEPRVRAALAAVQGDEEDSDLVAEMHALLAVVLTEQGRDAEAAASYARAQSIAPDDRRGGDALAGLAEAQRRAGRLDEAIAAARRAVDAYRRLDVPDASAMIRLTLGRLLLEAGRREEALATLDAARADAGVDPERSALGFLAARAGAEAFDGMGLAREASEQAARGLRVLRALSRGLVEGDSLGLRRDAEGLAALGVAACARWAAAEPARAAEAADRAYVLAEESRALLLAQGLRTGDAVLRRDLPAELVEADLRTRRAVEDARWRLLRRRAMPVDDAPGGREEAEGSGDPEPQAVSLDEAWRARDDAVLRMQRAARRTAAFVEAPAPDGAALRASLRSDEAVILYSLAARTATAVVVRPTATTVVDLGPADALRARLSGWLRLVATPDADDRDAAAALYDVLVRPLEPAIGTASRWVVVPEGELAFAPFDALLRRDGDRRERLVERATVVLAPSAGVWSTLRTTSPAPVPKARALLVGGPALGEGAGGLPPLPGAVEEAKEIAQRFPPARRALVTGRDATVERVLAVLRQDGERLSVVHFACHGVVDPSRPRGSGLVLAGGAVLDVDRLATERVPADLAVLSACDSGRGRVARGEGVFGLVRSFFLAGTPRVVASQWVVSDRLTRRFMARFYEAWRTKGLPVGVALAEAKRASLKEGGDAARPSTWAAFVVWGMGD